MTSRIMMKKLSLLHHIAKLSPDSVANQVHCLQKRSELPGLLQDCEEFIDKKISFNELSDEKFECKPYFRELNISMARDKFRLRSKMTRTVKFNFPSDKVYKADLWSC